MFDLGYTQKFIRTMWTFVAIVAVVISLGLGNWDQGLATFLLGAGVALIPATIVVWWAFPISAPIAMFAIYCFDRFVQRPTSPKF